MSDNPEFLGFFFLRIAAGIVLGTISQTKKGYR